MGILLLALCILSLKFVHSAGIAGGGALQVVIYGHSPNPIYVVYALLPPTPKR